MSDNNLIDTPVELLQKLKTDTYFNTFDGGLLSHQCKELPEHVLAGIDKSDVLDEDRAIFQADRAFQAKLIQPKKLVYKVVKNSKPPEKTTPELNPPKPESSCNDSVDELEDWLDDVL